MGLVGGGAGEQPFSPDLSASAPLADNYTWRKGESRCQGDGRRQGRGEGEVDATPLGGTARAGGQAKDHGCRATRGARPCRDEAPGHTTVQYPKVNIAFGDQLPLSKTSPEPRRSWFEASRGRSVTRSGGFLFVFLRR